MYPPSFFLPRGALLAACLLAALSPLHAQTPPAAPADQAGAEAPRSRPDSKIERIHIEDSGARVDELRVGGQTQTITVTPKDSAMPSYEVLPTDPGRSRQSEPGNVGPRVWNVLKF